MKHLTRRDFLKLCGTSSVGFALAACGVTPTPTATPLPTSTPNPTSTPLPTATPTATSTATATFTPIPLPSITEGGWARIVEGDTTQPLDTEKMFSVIGAIASDGKIPDHHKYIDLELGTLKLAAKTDQDTTKLDKAEQDVLRLKIASGLAGDAFITNLVKIRNQMGQIVEKVTGNPLTALTNKDYSNFTVVIDEKRNITQVIYQSGDTIKRYDPNKNDPQTGWV